ncbi:DNA polymerase/3'-5' exonuclease PolX [Thermanaeromonas sp. C210]|uniref:DNA polymerase/3'-5' exonuclease PolX n=1 Tax=Thermanaeromonas sp. C210 TaxID=2731925 RepID=UPI00155CDA9B|nr:DNA polymerase/3'-5' exonuclease PolX [Thermanaeromonas sp. C210]GFN23162.1 DNA polymerase/3'-5' exonuclease PolX [Thermanaeromonas sp. C210]
MTNLELSWALAEMGDLLELKGEEPFKVRAYQRAARALEHLEEEAASLYARGELERIPGVGKNLAKKIAELLETGRSTFLEQLRQEVPPGLRDMLAVPGLGAKSVRVIHQHLGITTLEELERAARERRIRQLPGMGSKTELAILRGLDMLKENRDRIPLGIARPLAQLFCRQLSALPGVAKVEVAGSLRRGCSMVGDVDLVVGVKGPTEVKEVMARHPQVKEVLLEEENRLSLRTWAGVKVEIFLVPEDKFAPAWLYLTGSPAHREELGRFAAERHLSLEKLGLPRRLEEAEASFRSEEEFYSRLELPFIVPEWREGRGEVWAAREGRLPALITLKDIKGDLHIHTRYSDGLHTIREMVEAARARGYRYMAITEHSRSLAVARGLSAEQLLAQREEIARLNRELDDFVVLSGIEVDILPDGRLDLEDDILASLDIVIASIHSGFNQKEEQIMARLEAAMRHPWVDIIGHPTGRMLGRRPSYAVNLERLLELAAETGTILEINASPDRLDLDEDAARRAKEYGVLLAINTDAHDMGRLEDMWYGITVARRGWLGPEDLLNTRELDGVLKALKRNRGNGGKHSAPGQGNARP